MDAEKANEIMLEIGAQEDEKEISFDQLSVPNWLVEVLAWISLSEMAQSSLSYSSRSFKELCWHKLHENVKPHKIKMEIRGEEDGLGQLQAIGHNNFNFGQRQPIPIPRTFPPDYILGFETISLFFMDDHVLEFFKSIVPRLNVINFTVDISMEGWGAEENQTASIRCLLELLANKMRQYCFTLGSNFNNFNRLFPGHIDPIESIWIYSEPFNEDPNFDALFNWLINRKIDGKNQQKMLELLNHCGHKMKFLERIKNDFSNAIVPLNFFIHFPNLRDIEFTLGNANTDEVLIAYGGNEEIGMNNLLLLRCPKSQENRWKKEGEEKMLANSSHKEATFIQLFAAHFVIKLN